MTIRELVLHQKDLARVKGDAETEIQELGCDSRAVTRGMLFFCVPGLQVDGHVFAGQAVEKGAVALVVERELPMDVPQIIVADVRAAMSWIAAAFFGYPAEKMKLIGVTGTKGKTTTTYFLRSIGKACGLKTGMLGTVVNMIDDTEVPATLTTPDPIDLQRMLKRMADAGVQLVAMEVSAHSLALRKLESVRFDVAVFTNLSHDHLDFFGTMGRYLDAKRVLFQPQYCKAAVFNADDDSSESMRSGLGDLPYMTYGVRAPADVYANDIEIHERGVSFLMTLGKQQREVHMHLSGIFNVYNSMAAAAAAYMLGLPLDGILQGLMDVEIVPGRVEVLDTGTPYSVILDYAHSPDSLESILSTVRQFTKGRLIVVFGCGGGRDREKRPEMGEIAGRLADISIITSDNPRGEDPLAILEAIEKGIRPTGGTYVVIENRRRAIAHALGMAVENDTVVLAGKGHETYQEISGVKNPFDERKIVRELLRGV